MIQPNYRFFKRLHVGTEKRTKLAVAAVVLMVLTSSVRAEVWMWASGSSSAVRPVDGLLDSDYAPVYEVSQVSRRTASGSETVAIELQAGDVVRAFGQLEAIEETCAVGVAGCGPAPVYALLAYQLNQNPVTRFSAYAKQHLAGRDNGRMPLNVSGMLTVATPGTYRFTLQARHTAVGQVVRVESQAYDGHLTVEIYRPTGSPDVNALGLSQALQNGPEIDNVPVPVCPKCPPDSLTPIGDAVETSVEPGDLVAAQAQFAALAGTERAFAGHYVFVETQSPDWTLHSYVAPREYVGSAVPKLTLMGTIRYLHTGTVPTALRIRSIAYALGSSYMAQAFTSRVGALQFSRSGRKFPINAPSTLASVDTSYDLFPAGDVPWHIVHRHEFSAASALRDGDVVRASGNLTLQFAQATMETTRCRARLYVVAATGPAFAVGQEFDPLSDAVRGFSPVTLRQISGAHPSASLPTWADVTVNWSASGATDATLVSVLHCDKVDAPDVVIPANFSGLDAIVYRSSDLIFANGFDRY